MRSRADPHLLDVSGLSARLAIRSAEPVSREDMLRVHGAGYVDRYKALSDGGGGNAGIYAFQRAQLAAQASALQIRGV
jgi:acetoin utilization deacetylase AcuC-like enzyme